MRQVKKTIFVRDDFQLDDLIDGVVKFPLHRRNFCRKLVFARRERVGREVKLDRFIALKVLKPSTQNFGIELKNVLIILEKW